MLEALSTGPSGRGVLIRIILGVSNFVAVVELINKISVTKIYCASWKNISRSLHPPSDLSVDRQKQKKTLTNTGYQGPKI